MALKSNVVILSEDQVLEAVRKYLQNPPFNYDIEYVELVDVSQDRDALFKFEFEAFDAS